MISKRSPSKRNLGPVLALTGAGIAIVAVIAGFIAVGGPGDARNQRLDETMEYRMYTAVRVLHCAFESTGAPPPTFDDAMAAKAVKPEPGSNGPNCGNIDAWINFTVGQGDTPDLGKISYRVDTPKLIRFCANFRATPDRPTGRPAVSEGQFDTYQTYPELLGERSKGIHCYDLDLSKTASLTVPMRVID